MENRKPTELADVARSILMAQFPTAEFTPVRSAEREVIERLRPKVERLTRQLETMTSDAHLYRAGLKWAIQNELRWDEETQAWRYKNDRLSGARFPVDMPVALEALFIHIGREIALHAEFVI
jgi:hypothetical protein